ncbi:MAG TPA: 50S ribosomal protein L28 [Candidatus Woesebacteria bacterium]|nr:50S ribosomal protein L28 [Candidatus Woesebacteria bacterium]HPJ17230.1 50S ribosomal protein L28 [Candidatus Woesebacteria bacterium]
MATKCDICGKGTTIGRNRSHAQNRTQRTFKANVHKVTLTLGEDKIGGSFCSRCIKRLRMEANKQKTALK